MAYTTINKSKAHFLAKKYVGNGGTLNVTGMDFQPDFSWLKCLGIGYHHALFDVARGVGNRLYSNLSSAQQTATSEGVTAFNSDGVTVVQGSTYEYNNNSVDYASWNWKGGGTASSNSDGSITSTVSANPTAGFSIVKWTSGSSGANTDTIGHGLNAVPKLIIIKTYDATDSLVVYHASLGAGKHLVLNNTNAHSTNADIFPTTPTSSVFYAGSTATTNGSSRSYVAYCFAEKTGYCKIGSWIGNSNSNGTFIYTGFRPQFILQKRDYAGGWWVLTDELREKAFNPTTTEHPSAQDTSEETTGANYARDLLSNGFKQRGVGDNFNNSNSTYYYIAIGQSLVGSNNVPCTAR